MLQKCKKQNRQSCQALHSLFQSVRVFTPTPSVTSQQTDVVRHGKCDKLKLKHVQGTSHADHRSNVKRFIKNKDMDIGCHD